MTAPPGTLNEIFFGAAERYASRPAVMRRKRDGRWHDVTFDTLLTPRAPSLRRAQGTAACSPATGVAILSENRPEWAIADFACLTARLADVPIYPTLTPSQTAYILRDSGAKGIFVSSPAFLRKILAIRHELPDLRAHHPLRRRTRRARRDRRSPRSRRAAPRRQTRHGDWRTRSAQR